MPVVIGGLLVLLSLFVTKFIQVQTELGPFNLTLAEVDGGLLTYEPDGALDSYVSLGRLLAIVVIAAAVLATLRLPALGRFVELPVLFVGLSGVFAVWHLLVMFANAHHDLDGVDTSDIDQSPVFGAWLGLAGWIDLAAGQFLR